MSSFYSDASLVLIPSGYKNQKVYSAVPTDGSGDLSFSRASSATRVASNGLIEKVRENLALYSEDYTNAYWTKGNVNISANSVANPVNGASTATTITPNTSSGSHYLQSNPLAMSANTEVSQSIYAKANGYNYVMLEGYDGSNNPKMMFNLSDGSFSTISASGSPVGSVEVLANGWYRLKMTWKTQAGSPNVYQYYFVYDNGSATSYAGNDTSGVYLFGAQLEYGVTTDYIATTTAAVSVGPVSGLPRLDYLGSTCPRLLLEPQRTNLALYSEQFDNAAWLKSSASVSANTTVSPDGSANADTLTTSAASGKLYRSFTSTAGSYTLSVFVKKGTSSTAFLNFYDGSISQYVCETVFNLNNGTFTGAVGGSAFITDYGNGFWRIGIIYTLGSSASSEISIGLSTTTTGNAFIYGAQLEAGAYATSYIPTLGASVTRVVDAALTASVPSLIGQTEGTLFVDFNRTDNNAASFFMISTIAGTTAASSQNSLYIFQIANGNLVCDGFVSNVQQFGFSRSPLSLGTHKIALAYKANDFALYVDGVQVATDTSGSVPAMNFLNLSNSVDGGPQMNYVNQALLFKTRLTNAQLAELTA
jgi:hypothetical protein